MFRIASELPLAAPCGTRYRGFCYDGCWFYVTEERGRTVHKLDACFREEGCYETCRSYTSLCYDLENDCFWGASTPCPATLFRLDTCFREVDAVHVRIPDTCVGVITGVSYDCGRKGLLISCGAGIVRVAPGAPGESRVFIPSARSWMQGVVALAPYCFVWSEECGQKLVRVYSQCGKCVQECVLGEEQCVESAVFFPSTQDFCHLHFYVLVSKCGRYPAVLDCVLQDDGLNVCDCNYALCKRCCSSDCDRCDREKGCGSVLESVALMEAALAHILNAEGEKIQKTLACTDDVEEMLRVNTSVQRTIQKTTFLEQLLCCKLETLSDFCGEESPCPPEPPRGCRPCSQR